MELNASQLWPAFLGCGTAVLACWIAALLAIRLRGPRFRRAKLAPTLPPYVLPDIPVPRRTEKDASQDTALYHLIHAEHERAKSLQDWCVAYLVSSSATLFVAFLVSAGAATILARSGVFHLYSAALDVAALGLVVSTFMKSDRLRADWIRQRALTEFLRQWTLTDFVLVTSTETVTPRYEAFERRVRKALAPDRGDLMDAVVTFSDVRLQEILAGLEGLQAIPIEALRFYLARRPIRQARWYSASAARISRQHSTRRVIMLGLFALALLAAVVKFTALLVNHSGEGPLANGAIFTLLLFIGLAAASTSAYLGQNLRSIRHRYRAQLRAIEDWFGARSIIADLASGFEAVGAENIPLIAEAVTAFESLMVTELVDWIAITTDDAMELAPA
jgi:hypothetical protein